MERVVLLVRVSTDKQDYERQINELSDYCRKMDWAIEKVFANKVSGAVRIEEREEICELINYVKTNDIRRVVCLEISRVGRNTLEALKVIQILNEHKVSLFVKNYNLETLDADGKVNPIAYSIIGNVAYRKYTKTSIMLFGKHRAYNRWQVFSIFCFNSCIWINSAFQKQCGYFFP